MKRRREAPANHDRWLVSYADLITLLFALFVILYAMSRTDVEKLKEVNQSMHEAFHDLQAQSSGAQPVGVAPSAGPSSAPSPVAGSSTAGSTTAKDPGFAQAQSQLKQVASGQESHDAENPDQVTVSEDDRGLVVSLAARDFFDDGVPEARAELRPLLDRIGKILSEIDSSVRVEGHTDLAEDGLHQKTGWILSTERASWVVQYWVKRWGMDPKRLSAAGLSHFHPLTSKRDDFSRGRNRRVEIIVIRKPASTP